MVRLVIVTGSGRSGTSSAAGTLKRLGCRIPQPEVPADQRNPRGYYEVQWVASFHKRWLGRVPVRTIDARPDAGDLAMASLRPDQRTELRDWLAAETEPRELPDRPDRSDVVVVKETRAYWVFPLWVDVAAEVGVDLVSLTMLRHPTQVVRSRDAAYLSGQSDDVRRRRETTNVAAWANSVFETERATRDNPRAFLPYQDLLADWRAAMTRVSAQFGVELGIGPRGVPATHPVDAFLTTDLDHAADTWAGLSVPDWLRDLAEETWATANVLVRDPLDAAATAGLGRLREEYVRRYADASALAADEVWAAHSGRSRVEDEVHRQAERLEQKNRRLQHLRAELRALRSQPGSPQRAVSGE